MVMAYSTCELLDCCDHSVPREECLTRESQARAWSDRARELGLDYDDECGIEIYLAGPYECSTLEQYDQYWACEVCALFHGNAALGESCEIVGLHMSTCGKGLVCGPDERCHAPCDVPEAALAGQRCAAELGLRCDGGLACDAAGRCVAATQLGQACDADRPCDVDGWCGPSSLCEPRVADGQACDAHPQCLSTLCEAGSCVAPTMPFCANPVL